MSNEILLLDLPSKAPCRSWSANVWKTRLALNYKNLPYKTEWVPYIRLQETIRATGVAPHPQPNWSDFSVPTIRLPDGRWVMDSAVIHKELEKLQPTPPLPSDEAINKKVTETVVPAFMALVPVFMPYIGREIVPEEDIEWFHADRSKRFGKPLEEVEKEQGPGGEEAWKKAGPGLDEVCKLLADDGPYKKDKGPFLNGSQPTYDDFPIIATMAMLHTFGDQFVKPYLGDRSELKRLWEASKQWAERDN